MKIINNDTEFRKRNLPHLERSGADYFVTWRLTNTIPFELINEIRVKLRALDGRALDRTNSEEQRQKSNDERKRIFSIFDKYLDSAKTGAKWLADDRAASLVKQTILDQLKRAEIHCFTIMPNHVHLLLTPRKDDSLRAIMKQIKQITSYHSVRLFDIAPPFWDDENYDHILREGEFARIVRYIIMNPVVAGLCKEWKDWPHTYLAENIPWLV